MFWLVFLLIACLIFSHLIGYITNYLVSSDVFVISMTVIMYSAGGWFAYAQLLLSRYRRLADRAEFFMCPRCMYPSPARSNQVTSCPECGFAYSPTKARQYWEWLIDRNET